MAKNKTTATTASVNDFINSVPDLTKRNDSYQIIELISKQTGFEPTLWGPNIIGFGSYHYKYESGHEGDAPMAAFSPRAQAIVFYLAAEAEGREEMLAKLGKHRTGKACIYVKKLADIDTDVLKSLAQESVNYLQKIYPPANA